MPDGDSHEVATPRSERRDGDGSPAVESALGRRWQRLDRGWQALVLGLAVVAVHAGWTLI